MRSFLSWVSKNGALSFLLGVQALALVGGLIWAISLNFEDKKPTPIEQVQQPSAPTEEQAITHAPVQRK